MLHCYWELSVLVDKVNTVMEFHVGCKVHMFGSHAHSTLFRESFDALARALVANLSRKNILQTLQFAGENIRRWTQHHLKQKDAHGWYILSRSIHSYIFSSNDPIRPSLLISRFHIMVHIVLKCHKIQSVNMLRNESLCTFLWNEVQTTKSMIFWKGGSIIESLQRIDSCSIFFGLLDNWGSDLNSMHLHNSCITGHSIDNAILLKYFQATYNLNTANVCIGHRSLKSLGHIIWLSTYQNCLT